MQHRDGSDAKCENTKHFTLYIGPRREREAEILRQRQTQREKEQDGKRKKKKEADSPSAGYFAALFSERKIVM